MPSVFHTASGLGVGLGLRTGNGVTVEVGMVNGVVVGVALGTLGKVVGVALGSPVETVGKGREGNLHPPNDMAKQAKTKEAITILLLNTTSLLPLQASHQLAPSSAIHKLPPSPLLAPKSGGFGSSPTQSDWCDEEGMPLPNYPVGIEC